MTIGGFWNILLKKREKTAIVLSVMVLFVVLFSAFYITANLHHDCCGEGCPVCEEIEWCMQTFRELSSGVLFVVAFFAIGLFLIRSNIIYSICKKEDTLISQKVRMNR